MTQDETVDKYSLGTCRHGAEIPAQAIIQRVEWFNKRLNVCGTAGNPNCLY